MTKYFVNDKAQPDSGDHEVHEDECSRLPELLNRTYLGEFSSCEEAVEAAKKIYSTADGCGICSPDCHTS